MYRYSPGIYTPKDSLPWAGGWKKRLLDCRHQGYLINLLKLNLRNHQDATAVVVKMQLIKNITKFNLHILNNCYHSWVKRLIAEFLSKSFAPYCVKYVEQVTERAAAVANDIWIHRFCMVDMDKFIRMDFVRIL